jgi:sensor histidine kinase YesM
VVNGIITAWFYLMLYTVALLNFFIKWKRARSNRANAENQLQGEKLENESANQDLLKQKTGFEMQMLRAQMNPHFIFNSLNAINFFILQNDKLQASEYLVKFSRLVRLILQHSQAALISLESELESLHLYLELESVRLDHMFHYKISVAPDIDAGVIKVPPLFIQPFAENAIWHGLMHKNINRDLLIELYYENDEVLCCKICDNGIGRIKAAEIEKNAASTYPSTGSGITAERIKLLQPLAKIETIKINDVLLPDGTPGGTEVLLKIPVRLD